MAFVRIILPFSAGLAAGVMLHKYWPEISEAGRPLLRASLRSGVNALEKGRSAVWEQSERFSDVISEIREEEEATAKAGGRPPGAPGGQAAPAGGAPPADPKKT